MATNLTVNILDIASGLPDNWLIGCDSPGFAELSIAISENYPIPHKKHRKICLAEPEPGNFLPFHRARAAKCPIFTLQSQLVKPKWQQVFDLVHPT